MTISTENSSIILAGNGSQVAFSYNFIADSASDITVSSIASNGSISVLSSTTYTVSVNAAAPNQLWGVGGTVTMNTAPASGTSLLIQRTLPFTQSTSIQNQGNIYPQVIETAMDTLEMQIQQVASRTTQFQGQWTTGTMYTVGDIVQDGANGNGTLSYYICQVGNTSGVWSSDLASGYWAISVQAVIPTGNQPITLSGAVTGTGSTAIATSLSANAVTNTAIISGAVTLSKMANVGPNTVLVNSSASSGTPGTVSLSSGTLVGMDGSNVAAITLGNTLSLSANTLSTSTPNYSQKQVVAATSAISGTTPLMVGLAGSFTPTSTGITFMQIKGWGENGNSDSATVQLNYGQGGAPGNGNASQGTPVGISQTMPFYSSGNGEGGEFTVGGIAALSTGIAYWLDITLKSISAGTSTSIEAADILAYEIK